MNIREINILLDRYVSNLIGQDTVLFKLRGVKLDVLYEVISGYTGENRERLMKYIYGVMEQM